jgi:general secretion pathway protein A
VYTEFFGLNEKPFSISPDPRYLYLSRRHADALAHLIYGISEAGGFIQLTGEVGTGKTTLIRSLLEQLPDKAEIALILNPQLSAGEFLQSICQELRVELPEHTTVKSMIDALNEQLLKAHAEDRRVVLIVDEAQTMSPALLEQVRLLTNLETAKRKLLQIILIGQPELRQLLARPEMRQVAQRVTGRYHLEPLSADDTFVYVKHRMKVAGAHAEVFTRPAIRQIYRQTRGIPRLINVVADRALLAAYTQDQSKIDGRLVKLAANEVFGRRSGRPWWPWALAAFGLAAFAVSTLAPWRPDGNDELETLAPAAADVAAPPAVAVLDDETPSLEALLDAGGLPDARGALASLFRLWHVEIDPAAADACDQAAAYGLRCLRLDGSSIGQLRQLGRPVMLSLRDAGNVEHRVVVSKFVHDQAAVQSKDGIVMVGIADFTHYRFGEHLMLWKPPVWDEDGLALSPGMRSDGVLWLRESLAKIRGFDVDGAAPPVYDAELEQWVRDYQRDRDLVVDGIVGAQTQLAILTDLGRRDGSLGEVD